MPSASKHPSGLPLPKHFEEKTTDNGRKYYINHKDETTSWVDPRDAMSKKLTWAECEGDEVPFGWELAAIDGQKYWIDHNNQTNTIDDPRLSEDRKEQETIVKERVDILKKSMNKNRQTLRKTKQKLEDAKEKMDEIEKNDDESEEAKKSRMEYRRQLSMHARVEREVEEGEAKIEALETIDFEELSVKKAGDVKSELETLNENFQKEVEEKNKIKEELQELKALVTGYMTKMTEGGDETHKAAVAARKEADREDLAHRKSLEKLDELNLEEARKVAEAAPAGEDKAPTPPEPVESAAMSSLAMKMELEQRKLENQRHKKEMEELRAAQRELRLLKEKHAQEMKAEETPFTKIKEAELPDWLFSSHVVKLLNIDGEDFDNDDALEDEIKTKVADYMEQQKNNADGLNFKSKLAFFTTLEIHDDVQRRKSDKQRTQSGRVVSGKQE